MLVINIQMLEGRTKEQQAIHTNLEVLSILFNDIRRINLAKVGKFIFSISSNNRA